MAIREATINKYINATRILHAHVAHGFEVDGREFASKHRLSNGFFTYLIDAGFMQKMSKRTYRWNNCPINHHSIGTMLEKRETQRGSTHTKTFISVVTPAANEIIEPVKEVVTAPEVKAPTPPEPYNLERISALEQRVASLEQLLIRRSIA